MDGPNYNDTKSNFSTAPVSSWSFLFFAMIFTMENTYV